MLLCDQCEALKAKSFAIMKISLHEQTSSYLFYENLQVPLTH